MTDKNLNLRVGKTQPLVLRCELDNIIYKNITGITQTAPARLTVPAHGLTDGWRVAVTNVKGMSDINAEANAIRTADYKEATVVDADTITLNKVNAAGFKPYVSGGVLQYNEPMDLTDFAARMQIRNKKNGATLLLEMTTDNGMIAIDHSLKTVTIYFDAVDFTNVSWASGYYELELFKTVTRVVNGTPQTVEVVYSPFQGFIYLEAETTK